MRRAATQTRRMVVRKQHYTVFVWRRILSTTLSSDVGWSAYRWYYSGVVRNWRMEKLSELILLLKMRFVCYIDYCKHTQFNFKSIFHRFIDSDNCNSMLLSCIVNESGGYNFISKWCTVLEGWYLQICSIYFIKQPIFISYFPPLKGRGTLFLVWIALVSMLQFLVCTISHETVCRI